MATIIAQPTPRVGTRMLVVGLLGVLLGGFAGGLVSRAFQSRGDAAITRPASELALSPEAIRGYVGSTATQAFSPEAIRGYVGSTSTEVFSPEAVRVRSYVAGIVEEALSPEALRMRAGSSHTEAFSPEAARLEN